MAVALAGLMSVPSALLAGGVGTSGGNILSIGVGARAIAMGEAYTAMADDVSSLYWNPAGLALLNQSQASFMYNQFLKDLTYQNAGVALPLENGGVGASLSYLTYGQIQGFDPAGNPTGNVNAYSGVGTVGGAWLGDTWSAGFNVKGVQESLADVKANGVAADFGATLVYPHEVKGGTLRAAATLRNLGSGLKFIDQTDPFPREWRVGMSALEMLNRRLNLSMDYGQERDNDGAIYAGAEYWFFPFFALRAGYAGSHTEGSGLRAGVGLKFKDLSFDYAYSNYGDLGLSHRYELTVRFGVINPRLTPEERKLFRRAKLAMAQERYGEATQLLDALIQMEPTYRPFRRLVRVAMSGYERDERSQKPFGYSTLAGHKSSNNDRSGDAAELKDLENLLNMSDNAWAQSTQKADSPNRGSK